MNVTLIVPTYNAGDLWKKWIKAYQHLAYPANQVIVIDSDSTDQTAILAEQAGFFVHKIAKSTFNHGGTRNLAAKLADQRSDILVFMTQDALFATPNALERLLQPFSDPMVAAVCGRQLPHIDANPLAAHARLFNYPSESRIKSREDIQTYGIKTAFVSNSFSAYRKRVFDELEGFPNDTILSEDMYLAAKMILAGYKVAYCAEATVYHSHNYTLKQEFQRYFDIGVFQTNQSWIQDRFGKAENEGKKFVLSELRYLRKNAPHLIIKAMFSTLSKYVGFKAGLLSNQLPSNLCRRLSMHKEYWRK